MRNLKLWLIRAALITAFIASNHVIDGGVFDLFVKVGPVCAQQNTWTSTTLSQAITSSQKNIPLASATGISGLGVVPGNSTDIYIDRELMQVNSVNTVNNSVNVTRGVGGTQASAHISGSTVLAGQPSWFLNFDPEGSCTQSQTVVSPWINQRTALQWICSTVTNQWVPGFGNPGVSGTPLQVTTAVASAAGAVTPSGPYFHITGALAITGFNLPTGFNGGCFTAIADGGYTWTAAGNIAVASAAAQVVGTSNTFCWDRNTSKWYPTHQ